MTQTISVRTNSAVVSASNIALLGLIKWIRNTSRGFVTKTNNMVAIYHFGKAFFLRKIKCNKYSTEYESDIYC